MSLFRNWLPVIAALLWMAAASAASAADLVGERGYRYDPGGRLSLQDVQSAHFTPFEGPLSHGNNGVPLWLRLVVPPQAMAQRELVLLIQPATVEDVRVYVQDAADGWQMRETGSRFAFSARPGSDLNYALPVTVSSSAATLIYLRVESRTALVYPRVMTGDEARDLDSSLHVKIGLYVGITLISMVLCIIMWISTRYGVWGAAALYDLLSIAYALAQTGLMAKYLLPDAEGWMPILFELAGIAYVVVSCLMFGMLTRMLLAPRWVWLGYYSALAVAVPMLAEIATGHDNGAVFGQVNVAAVVYTLWGIVAALTLRTPDRIMRWTYRLLNGVVVAYMLVWFLSVVHTGPALRLSVYPGLPLNLFVVLIMTLLLARRTMLDVRMRYQLEREKREVEQSYRLEQAHHAETSGMLGMIMHEVKNPLASIRVASELLSSGRVRDAADRDKRFRNIQDAVDGIDAVLQRCIEVERLDRGALNEEREPEDLADLLRYWIQEHRHRQRLVAQLPEILLAEIDARLLLLMLGNLVDNALKYSPEGSAVHVRLLPAVPRIGIEIRNGVGRAGWPDPARLFQKFYRSASAQREGGTGLGLYWVHNVATRIGGSVQYRRDGDEIVFTLEIPI